jgi:DNA-binding NarL/FixJ family response regulator
LSNCQELHDTIEAVLNDSAGVRHRHDLDPSRPLAVLSRKQIEVLVLLAQGQSNARIAQGRGTSIRAVEGMVSRIFEALDIEPNADGNARVEAAGAYIRAVGSKSISV